MNKSKHYASVTRHKGSLWCPILAMHVVKADSAVLAGLSLRYPGG